MTIKMRISQEPKNSNKVGLQLGTKMNMERDKFHTHLETGLKCHSQLQWHAELPNHEGVTLPLCLHDYQPPTSFSHSFCLLIIPVYSQSLYNQLSASLPTLNRLILSVYHSPDSWKEKKKKQSDWPSSVFELQGASEPPGELKLQSIGPCPSISDLAVWGRAWEFAFLTKSQVMLTPLVWGPHLRTTGLVNHPFICLDRATGASHLMLPIPYFWTDSQAHNWRFLFFNFLLSLASSFWQSPKSYSFFNWNVCDLSFYLPQSLS